MMTTSISRLPDSPIPLPKRILYEKPKTPRSKRVIDLIPITCGVLRRHLEAEMLLCRQMGIRFTGERLLFCEWDGALILPGRVSLAWPVLIKKLGFTHVRFHDARHTHASLLLKADVHPKVVQERLGHAHIQTTMDIYSHVLPGMQRAAAEAFGRMVVPKVQRAD